MMFSVEGFRTTTVYFGLYDLAKAVSSQQARNSGGKPSFLTCSYYDPYLG